MPVVAPHGKHHETDPTDLCFCDSTPEPFSYKHARLINQAVTPAALAPKPDGALIQKTVEKYKSILEQPIIKDWQLAPSPPLNIDPWQASQMVDGLLEDLNRNVAPILTTPTQTLTVDHTPYMPPYMPQYSTYFATGTNTTAYLTNTQIYYTPITTNQTFTISGNWTTGSSWWNQYATETPAQKKAREVRQRQQEIAWKKKEKERSAAKLRAEDLLFDCLDDSQIIDFKTRRAFTVRSQSGKLFELREGRSRNIKLLNEDGSVKKTYCIHPGDAVPDGDTLLAQKLWLETNEIEFYKIANAS